MWMMFKIQIMNHCDGRDVDRGWQKPIGRDVQIGFNVPQGERHSDIVPELEQKREPRDGSNNYSGNVIRKMQRS
jgi:hypothetical protein